LQIFERTQANLKRKTTAMQNGKRIIIAVVLISVYFLPDTSSGLYAQRRVVHFPKDRSLGNLLIQDESVKRQIKSFFFWTEDGTEWKPFGQARGDVTVPDGMQLALVVGQAGLRDLSPLSGLDPNALYKLTIYGPPSPSPKPDDRIMPHIAHLTGLRVLELEDTLISAKGIKYLHNLKSLERLSISKVLIDNGLAEVAQIQSLKGLYLRESRITNAGLAHLANLTSLEELALGQGRMTNAGLAHLAKLPSLQYLMLAGKDFTDAGMAYLKNIPSLRILHVGHLPQLTDAALVHLARIKTLENLTLHEAEAVTDDGIVCLKQLPCLKMLDIGYSKVTDKGLYHLSQINSLEYLELPREGISDEGLIYLGGLNNLKHLHVARIHYIDPNDNKVFYTDKGVAELTKCKKLEELNIGSIGITDLGMEHIEKLTNLKRLNLFGCTNVTDRGLAKLTTLKSLQELYVHEANLTIGGLSVLEKLPNLVKLNLHGVRQDDSGLDLSRFIKLEEISLQLKRRHVNKKTVKDVLHDNDLACFANLKQLKWLQVSHGGITDDGLKYLAGLINIERLSVGGEKVTDKGLLYLTNMPKLDVLCLSGNFTDEALVYLERLPALQLLDIMEGAHFSQEAMQRFCRNMPELRTFRPNMLSASRQPQQQPRPQRPVPTPMK
jgi:Leucine-rich repeat (LRR) protein